MCKVDNVFKDALERSQKVRDVLLNLSDSNEFLVKVPAIPNVFTPVPKEVLAEGRMEIMDTYGEENTRLVYMEPGSISKMHDHPFPETVFVILGEVTYIIKGLTGNRKGTIRKGESITIDTRQEHVLLTSTKHSYISLTL